MNKTFLKWAGNKLKLMPVILPYLAGAKTVIDPFMGGGSLLLNHEAEHYIGGDINLDLVRVFNLLKTNGSAYIDEIEKFFSTDFHGKEEFYALRLMFNERLNDESHEAILERAAMFVALNKTCFNGLCRYNKHGAFTTPWNHAPKAPTMPKEALQVAVERMQVAEVFHTSFEVTVKRAKEGDAVYCDPPYLPPDGKDDAFTAYSKEGFSLEQQQLLATLAEQNQRNGVVTVISNQDCKYSRSLYKNATTIVPIDVKRSINRYKNHADTNSATEILAVYLP